LAEVGQKAEKKNARLCCLHDKFFMLQLIGPAKDTYFRL